MNLPEDKILKEVEGNFLEDLMMVAVEKRKWMEEEHWMTEVLVM